MSVIPDSFLTKMGTYNNINIHGAVVTVIVDTQECASITETRISDFRSYVERNNVKVVGVDVKKKTVKTGSIGDRYVLALYASNRSLIIHLDEYGSFPGSVYRFIKDSANVCFVGSPQLFQKNFNCSSSIRYSQIKSPLLSWKSLIVGAGDLAARVLKKPGLTTSTMNNIAREVGLVQYDIPPNGSGPEVEVDSRNMMVLTEEMVKNTINDAVANYLIGCKLFGTTTVETEN